MLHTHRGHCIFTSLTGFPSLNKPLPGDPDGDRHGRSYDRHRTNKKVTRQTLAQQRLRGMSREGLRKPRPEGRGFRSLDSEDSGRVWGSGAPQSAGREPSAARSTSSARPDRPSAALPADPCEARRLTGCVSDLSEGVELRRHDPSSTIIRAEGLKAPAHTRIEFGAGSAAEGLGMDAFHGRFRQLQCPHVQLCDKAPASPNPTPRTSRIDRELSRAGLTSSSHQ
jgi:hypothetical protein